MHRPSTDEFEQLVTNIAHSAGALVVRFGTHTTERNGRTGNSNIVLFEPLTSTPAATAHEPGTAVAIVSRVACSRTDGRAAHTRRRMHRSRDALEDPDDLLRDLPEIVRAQE